MKKVAMICLVMVFVVIGYAGISKATCSELKSPVFKIQLNRLNISATWDAVPGATGYTLYYAPYPEVIWFTPYDLGNTLSWGMPLWPGASYYIAIGAYNTCTKSDDLFYQYFIAGTDLHYGLTHNYSQAIIEIKANGTWSEENGSVSGVSEGEVFYLHSHLKDRDVGTCDNVLAVGVVVDGWIKFIFDNPMEFVDLNNPESTRHVLDHYWITDQYCTGSEKERHLWIPEKAKNPLYVLNCDGNPALSAVHHKKKMVPVPEDTPCVIVGIDCLDLD